MNLDAFVEQHSNLLKLERTEELEQNAKAQERLTLKELENKGLLIKSVYLESCHTGLYGRRICKFRAWKRGDSLPANKFSSGDIAGVVLASDSTREVVCSGVVTNVTQGIISVAIDGAEHEALSSDDGRCFHLFKLANDVTYRRLQKTLEKMRKDRWIRFSPLVELFFGSATPSETLPSQLQNTNLNYFNKSLDASQKEAVDFSLNQKEVCIIHGPPGTGKTTTIVEVVLQLVRHGAKVLACAPSNIAVDNLVEKLIAYEGSAKVVRLGHPARVSPEIQRHSLDAILARSDDCAILNDIRKELDSLISSVKKNGAKDSWCKIGQRRRDLQKEFQQRERKSMEHTLRNADIVLSTLTTASDDGPLGCLPHDYFHVTVVDECSQALEVACWMALLRAPKCVLAGDHMQLPPTIVSKRAAEEGLSMTLMERLLKLHGHSIMRMLTVQYRMNMDIMQWSSDKFYNGKLVGHHSVAHHLLRDLPGVEDNEASLTPLLLIDTAGCKMYELDTADKDSKGNKGEADLVSIHVEKLISCGLKAAHIAVISPYNLQLELLRLRLASKHRDLEIRSVDGFQGREKEAVVMSFVRSNTEGAVGFLTEERRINVAVTRARRHLAVVCDSSTVSRDPFMKSLVEYLKTCGVVQCAREYSHDLDFCESALPSELKQNRKETNTKPQKSNLAKKKGRNDIVQKDSQPVKPKLVLDLGIDREEWILKEVKEFSMSTKPEHRFPTTLNSYERRLVHEAAENFGLFHISEGDGAERQIVLRKAKALQQPTSGCVREAQLPQCRQTEMKGLTSDRLSDEPDKLEGQAERTVGELSLVLDESQAAGGKPLCRPGTKHKNKQGKAVAKTKRQDQLNEEQFEAVVASFTAAHSSCSHPRCQEQIMTALCGLCPLCKRGFCFSHALPEVHGCGDAARAAARAAWKKSAGGTRGPPAPMKAEKRLQVKMALNNKLNALAEQRKGKKDK